MIFIHTSPVADGRFEYFMEQILNLRLSNHVHMWIKIKIGQQIQGDVKSVPE